MSTKLSLINISEADLSDHVFESFRDGLTKRKIAQRFDLSLRDVERILTTRVSEYKPEDRALAAYVDVADLDELMRRLRTLARETVDPRTLCEATVAWNRLCETKAELLGLNAPRRTENQLNLIETPKVSSNEKLRAAIERVVAERPAQVIRPQVAKDGEDLPLPPPPDQH